MRNRTSARIQARNCLPKKLTITNNNWKRFCVPLTTRQSKKINRVWCLCLTHQMETYLMMSVVSFQGKAWFLDIWVCHGMVHCISKLLGQSLQKRSSRRVSLAEAAFILHFKTLKTAKIKSNLIISGLNTLTKLISTLSSKCCLMLRQCMKCHQWKNSRKKHK